MNINNLEISIPNFLQFDSGDNSQTYMSCTLLGLGNYVVPSTLVLQSEIPSAEVVLGSISAESVIFSVDPMLINQYHMGRVLVSAIFTLDGTDALHSSDVYGNLNSNFIVTDPTSNVNIALTNTRPMWY